MNLPGSRQCLYFCQGPRELQCTVSAFHHKSRLAQSRIWHLDGVDTAADCKSINSFKWSCIHTHAAQTYVLYSSTCLTYGKTRMALSKDFCSNSHMLLCIRERIDFRSSTNSLPVRNLFSICTSLLVSCCLNG